MTNLCHRDQLYNFRWRYKNEQHDVESRSAFRKLCKQRGLVPVTADDLLRHGAPYKPAPQPLPRERIMEAAIQAKQHMTPARIEQVWRHTQDRRR